jgi:hypothetical protein
MMWELDRCLFLWYWCNCWRSMFDIFSQQSMHGKYLLVRLENSAVRNKQNMDVNFQWDDDEVRFVLDQHTELDCYSASSLKQQSVDRHVAALGHNILILSQPVCSFSLIGIFKLFLHTTYYILLWKNSYHKIKVVYLNKFVF